MAQMASTVLPDSLKGGFFPKYYVYDGGPGDEDGKRDGTLTYTTYFGNGPVRIPGLSRYLRDVLGLPFPNNAFTESDYLSIHLKTMIIRVKMFSPLFISTPMVIVILLVISTLKALVHI